MSRSSDNCQTSDHWIPKVCPQARLYRDPLLERWVISRANQAVFLDRATYEVLKCCNGVDRISTICDRLRNAAWYEGDALADHVRSTIDSFTRRGFLYNARIDSIVAQNS